MRKVLSKYTSTLRTLFKYYPYKSPIMLGNGQDANYYIKKSEIVDNHVHSVNFFIYQKVIELFLEELFEYVMNGFKYDIPHGLGSLQLVKYKSKRRRVDYKTFNETGQIKYLDNFHTDGFIVGLNWTTTGKVFKNKYIYTFRLVETKLYELSKRFKEDMSLINKCVLK